MPYSLRHSTRPTATLPISQDDPVSDDDNNGNNNFNNSDTENVTTNTTTEHNEEPNTTTTSVQHTPHRDTDNRDSDSNTSQQESPPAQPTRDLMFWNGEPPVPKGVLAKLFTNTDTQAELETCEEIAKLIFDDDNANKANSLQFDTNLVPFLMAVPGTTRKLRLIYGVGTGIGLTGIHSNNLENQVLALTGEYEEGVTFPSVLQLPGNALTPIDLKIPSFAQFQEELGAGNTRSTWFKYANLVTDANLPLMVPFPAVYISDGFETDLDAADVFERLDSIPINHQDILQHSLHLLRSFITATVVRYKKTDPTIFAPLTSFVLQPSTLLNKWKKNKMKSLFPTLFNVKSDPKPTTVAPLPPPPVSNNNDWSPEAFIKAFASMQTDNPTVKSKESSSTDETLGMGKFAYNLLLDLCGLAPSTADEIIPLWKNLAEKNLSKADKLTFVRRSIEERVKWSEAKVLPLTALLTMIVNRTWEGETTLSSLTSAAKGLTPFAVPCLSESEVTEQNDMAEALDSASSTTVKDHSTLKLVASAPTTFDSLVKRIKRFGNLLYAIFGETSALFMQLEDMITALDAYGEHARASMTHQTIASILWITHIQARHYAAGAMKGDTALKAEFTNMMNAILTKAPIIHMDTPPKLYETEKKSPNKRTDPSQDANEPANPYKPDRKKQRPDDNRDRFQLVERNIMHPKMKIAMKPILTLQRVPNMGKICRAARINAGDLFPNHKEICIRSQVLGTCFSSCSHKHMKLDDSDIEKALHLLNPVISNPSSLKVN
jgi:hypothetical protein